MCRFLLEQVVAPFFSMLLVRPAFSPLCLAISVAGMVVVAVALVGLKEGLVPTGADNARRLSDF